MFVVFGLIGCGEAEPEIIPTPTYSAQEILGSTVFAKECGACHSLAADTVIVGPSMNGIAARASTRVEGQDAYTYILSSILKPNAYLVEPFEDLMPSTLGKTMTGEEVDAVIAFLLRLE